MSDEIVFLGPLRPVRTESGAVILELTPWMLIRNVPFGGIDRRDGDTTDERQGTGSAGDSQQG